MRTNFRPGEVAQILQVTTPVINGLRAEGIPGLSERPERTWSRFGVRDLMVTAVMVILTRDNWRYDQAREVAARAAPKFDEMLNGARNPDEPLWMWIRRTKGPGGVIELAELNLDMVGEPTALFIDLAKIYRQTLQRIAQWAAEKEGKQ
jgi:hypothetical protein